MPEPTRRNDVLLTSEAPLGRVALISTDDPLLPAQRIFGLRGKSGVLDSKFLFYALQTSKTQAELQSRATGTTVVGIRQSALLRVRVLAPELEKQRAIAEVLGSLDDKIAANSRIIEILDDLGVSLLNQFSPAVPLRDIVIYHKRPVDPSVLGNRVVDNFSLPAFDAGSLPEVISAESIKSQKFAVDQPSVLVSKLNPRFPRIWGVIPAPGSLSLASTEFLVLESRFSTATFLRALLSQASFSAKLESRVAGTSGSHQRVRPVDVLTARVIDPRQVPVQLRDLVSSLGVRAHAARIESSRLVALRDTLLPALMSGKLRVKDAEKQLVGFV